MTLTEQETAFRGTAEIQEGTFPSAAMTGQRSSESPASRPALRPQSPAKPEAAHAVLQDGNHVRLWSTLGLEVLEGSTFPP